MLLLLTAVLAFGIAVVLTRAAIPWLARVGSVAHENDRTMHTGVVPKGGGATLLAASFLSVAALAHAMPVAEPSLMLIGIAAALLAAVSWRDDLGHLSPGVRLAAHIAVAALVVLSFPHEALFFQGLLPWYLDRLIAGLALAWMMNLYNFMDGINGMAGMETVAIAAGYLAVGAAAAIALPYATLAAALAGASAGFLVWNARRKPLVFLGDVGSITLGFLTGVLMLDLAAHGLWAPALILPAYFLADATLTLLLRLYRRETLWHSHRSHAYQRAALGLGSHLQVVGRVLVADAALIGAATLSVGMPVAGIVLAAVVLAGLFVNLEANAHIRFWDIDRRRP